MWISSAILCYLVIATFAIDEHRPKRKEEGRGKRNLQYSVSHHYSGPHSYRVERRISNGPQLPLYHPQLFPGPRPYSSYYKGRPHSLPAPSYAVQMEPLVHYSQRDPFYDTNILSLNAGHNENARDQLTDHNHLSAHQYGPPQHIVERPVYIKEPEPIIEIIIKESNVTLPPLPTAAPPPKKKKEQVQVFYVKYKKNPNGYGKDSVIYDKPVLALSPHVHEEKEEEEIPQEYYHHETVTIEPPPSTTLRTIIKPDSEVYHSPSGVKVTFGKEGFDYEKRSSKVEDFQSSQQSSPSAQPQGRQLSFSPNFERRPSSPNTNFRPQPPRQSQPYRPFDQPQFKSQFPRSPSGQPLYSTLPKSAYESQPPPKPQNIQFPTPRPNSNSFSGQFNSLPQYNQPRQPVAYQPFESLRTQNTPQPQQQIQFRPQTQFNFNQQIPFKETPKTFASQNNQQFPPRPIPPSHFNDNHGQIQSNAPPVRDNFIKPQFSQPPVQNHRFPPSTFSSNNQQSNSGPPGNHQLNSDLSNNHQVSFDPPNNHHSNFGSSSNQQLNFNLPSNHQNSGPPSNPQQNFIQTNNQQSNSGPPRNNQFNYIQPNPQQSNSEGPRFTQEPHFSNPHLSSQKINTQNYQNAQFGNPNQHINQQSQAQNYHTDNLQIVQNVLPSGGQLIASLPKFEQHISLIEPTSSTPRALPLERTTSKPSESSAEFNQKYLEPNHLYHSIHKPNAGSGEYTQQKSISSGEPNKPDTALNDYNRQIQQQYRQANLFQESIRQNYQPNENEQLHLNQNFYNNQGNSYSTSGSSSIYTTTRPVITSTSYPNAQSSTEPEKPSTTTKDPKILEAQLPDEVPEDLRQQLLSSGILNNADISILDYDKVGDIPLSALPPDQLANFYNAGGSQQLAAAGSEQVPQFVRKDGSRVEKAIKDDEEDQEAAGSEIQEVKVQRDDVQMKVVHYDPQTAQGQQVQDAYVKEDATQVNPVSLNDSKYNRYLPLKVSGAHFPIPDAPELKGKKISSVVVLAPVNFDYTNIRKARDAKNVTDDLDFIQSEALKKLLMDPTSENYNKFLENQKTVATEKQAVILLVTGSDDKNREIFMYDVTSKAVSMLDGDLSAAFVEAAEENSPGSEKSAESVAASSIIETRIPFAGENSDNIDQNLNFTDGASSDGDSNFPIIDPSKEDLTLAASEQLDSLADVSGIPISGDLSVSENDDGENRISVSSNTNKSD